MSKKVDTIIIGGGIGGTALGALLASAGQNVELYEKNSIIGGRCTSYEKDGFIVDLGVHLFGLSEKGPLGDVLTRSGKPDAIEWVLARKPRASMYFNGQLKPFTRDMLLGQIEEKEYGNLLQLFMSMLQMEDKEINELWYVSLFDYASRFTKDESIHAMFAMLCGIYFCVPPDVTSAAEFITTFKELSSTRSSAYPKGGCISIPKAYQGIIEENGGRVFFDAPVDEIIIENGEAKGIRVNGSVVEADRVVSNADIKTTIGGMAPAEHFPADYIKRVQNLTYTAHVISIKVALDKKITDEKMVMYAPEMSEEEIKELSKKYFNGEEMPMMAAGMMNSPTNFDEALAPEGKQLVFFGTKCERHQDWRQWGDICLKALVDMFPDIEKHILWTKVDSPDTVAYYAGEDGNVIGVGQTIDQIHERRPTHETPVKGLYLCGAEAGGHGIGTELAASSAIELADKLLGSV